MNDQLRQLLTDGIRAAHAYGRADLAARLEARVDGAVCTRVVVAGEFKRGKSSLINALVGADVCPVDDGVATVVPTIVRYGDTARAFVRAADGDAPAPVDWADFARAVTEDGNPANERGLAAAEVTVPCKELQGGLELVDTPGLGGLDSAAGAATLALLPQADAVVLVTDAAQELTAPELDFLARAASACPAVACALTKTDLFVDWRQIADLDRGHLAGAGLDVPVVPISAVLRRRALADGDDMLHPESGPTLTRWLRDNVVADAVRFGEEGARRDLLWTIDQMTAPFLAEHDALVDSVRTEQTVDRLHDVRRQADRLRSDSSRWQVVLSDGTSDLTNDLEYELRRRLRDVAREAEHAIDASDPGAWWEELSAAVAAQATAVVADMHLELGRGAQQLASTVAGQFGTDGAIAGPANPNLADLDSLAVDALSAPRATLLSTGVTALRGSYGGVLMFGLVGRMAGLSLLNPIGFAVGGLLGGKTVRDEREKQLLARRHDAKTAVRRYIEEVTFVAGKGLRDAVRHIHRELRDAFAAQAEETYRSAADALAAAERAARLDQTASKQRAADVQAELRRLRTLRSLVERAGP